MLHGYCLCVHIQALITQEAQGKYKWKFQDNRDGRGSRGTSMRRGTQGTAMV